MTALPAILVNQREIIDRRALADRLAGESRSQAAAVLRDALAAGREDIARRLAERPYAGIEMAGRDRLPDRPDRSSRPRLCHRQPSSACQPRRGRNDCC
jgi:hypothetical protein